VSDDAPIYSDLEVVQDTGRRSFSEAAEEAGGVDSFRRDFAESSRKRQAGAFRNSPETQRAETVEAEPLSTDDALDVLGENFALRARVEEAEYEAEWANDSRLDEMAYATYETREDYEDVADQLLAAGGGDRLFALTQNWNERDPDGAAQWVKQAEYAATVATAQAGQQAMQEAQTATEAAFAKELNDFQDAHPETRAGGLMHEFVATRLAGNPGAWSSPEAFKQALEQAYEVSADVANGALSAASELDFRSAFRHESLRHGSMRPPSRDHLASMRPIGPESAEAFAADITAKTRGTKAQRQAALQARDADFKAQFAQTSRGSGFGEGAREQVARALEAREEERQGLRAPNRGV
jgi:hypothetical protein